MNISPRRIEDILLEHPAVAEASVVGVEHEFYGEEVVAAIRLLSGHRLDDVRSALELVCKSHLSAASMPNRFVEVSEFPMSVTGKVQKAKLARALSSNS